MKKLELAEWAAMAEILSSVAVLATLIFLVWEIRQNTEAVKANTYQELNATVMGFNSVFFANPEVSEFVARTRDADTQLTESEAIRLRAFLSAMYRHADNIYFQYELGTLTERQMRSLLLPIVLNIQRRPRLMNEWQNGADRAILNPALVDFIDRELQGE